MIRHIVMWKFREGEAENREKFLSGLQALDGVIPEIRHMEIHRSCKPGNPYDACLIADFDDLDALSRYKNDPRHVAVSTPVSYTHLTLPTKNSPCRSRWSPYH